MFLLVFSFYLQTLLRRLRMEVWRDRHCMIQKKFYLCPLRASHGLHFLFPLMRLTKEPCPRLKRVFTWKDGPAAFLVSSSSLKGPGLWFGVQVSPLPRPGCMTLDMSFHLCPSFPICEVGAMRWNTQMCVKHSGQGKS